MQQLQIEPTYSIVYRTVFLLKPHANIVSICCYREKDGIRLVEGLAIEFSLPIIASNPHFLDVDPAVANAVEGMHPVDEIHRSFGDIEPKTGSMYSFC